MSGIRLRDLRKKLGISQSKLGQDIDLNEKKISDLETDKHKINADIADKLRIKYSVSTDWILFGRGEIFLEKNQETDDETIKIKKLSHKASAGSGDITDIEVYDTGKTMSISASFFKTMPNPNKLRIMQVDGYSMIPMVLPDTWVIFELASKYSGDGLYIVNYDDNLMVKLLQVDERGQIEIISRNPDYSNRTIDKDDQSVFKVCGKVLRVIM